MSSLDQFAAEKLAELAEAAEVEAALGKLQREGHMGNAADLVVDFAERQRLVTRLSRRARLRQHHPRPR